MNISENSALDVSIAQDVRISVLGVNGTVKMEIQRILFSFLLSTARETSHLIPLTVYK